VFKAANPQSPAGACVAEIPLTTTTNVHSNHFMELILIPDAIAAEKQAMTELPLIMHIPRSALSGAHSLMTTAPALIELHRPLGR